MGVNYDQSALGCFDSENYNIGFLDVCNRPYESLAAAARESQERLYQLVAGKLAPYAEMPDHLPLLFYEWIIDPVALLHLTATNP